MSTQRERDAKKRVEKLEDVQDAVDTSRGNLVIRQMTPEERAANPPRPRQEKPKRRWR